MDRKNRISQLSSVRLWGLTVLRIVIGWHFLYEGMVKLVNPDWTSAAFLAESRWIFSGIFHWMASNQTVLDIVDFLNIWGLILIGLGLILGLFSRIAAISGAVLLALYYIAIPPLIGYTGGMPTEGNYLFVDKNLVELFSLVILALFPTGKLWGLDRVIAQVRAKKVVSTDGEEKPVEDEGKRKPNVFLPRRELLKNLISLPVLGGFIYAFLKKRGWESYEERHLLAVAENVDAITTATIKTFQFSTLEDLKGKVPQAQLGNIKLSRLFLGGNLIGGWAHARDLIYVSKLVKAYHNDEKVFETFRLADQCGINTIIGNPVMARVINKYRRTQGGKIQWIADCVAGKDLTEGVKISIDGGADAIYVEGQLSEELLERGEVEEIGKAVELIRQNGFTAGIGAHMLGVVKACVDLGIRPDFWVKTLHHHNYWTAQPEKQPLEPFHSNPDFHDNIWCVNPEETIEYMNNLEEPWIAFKILAAGAIHPKEGFQYAFENGADFITVGMYDFQIVEDVNIALDVLSRVLSGDLKRKRRWIA